MTPNYLEGRYEAGDAAAEIVSTVEKHYRYHQMCYQVIDMVVSCFRDRFQQKVYIKTLQTMEILLLKALPEEDFCLELQ